MVGTLSTLASKGRCQPSLDEGKGISMKKLNLIWLVMLVVFAFGMITASAAVAESQWLWEKEPVTVKLSAETEGEILFKEDGTSTTFLCSVTFVGSVGPGAADEILEITNLSLVKESTTNLAGSNVPALSCVIVEKGLCSEANGTLIWVIPFNFPWATKIVLDEGTFVDQFPLNASYEFSCNTFIGKQSDVCSGGASPVGADLTNEIGGVLGEFLENELTNPGGSCTLGGAGTWLMVSEGPALTFHPAGGTLEVSE